MKTEVIVLNKNFYEMDNNRGANLVILGETNKTDFQDGLSVTEAPIKFEDHHAVTTFPGKYSATMKMVEVKKSNGKKVAGISLSDLHLMSAVQIREVNLNK